jgi:hypothetical protein
MDNEAARRAKISESNKKRQQNALPVWHQHSTISTPITGTGDREVQDEEGDSDEEDQFEAVDNEEYDQDRADCKLLRMDHKKLIAIAKLFVIHRLCKILRISQRPCR